MRAFETDFPVLYEDKKLLRESNYVALLERLTTRRDQLRGSPWEVPMLLTAGVLMSFGLNMLFALRDLDSPRPLQPPSYMSSFGPSSCRWPQGSATAGAWLGWSGGGTRCWFCSVNRLCAASLKTMGTPVRMNRPDTSCRGKWGTPGQRPRQWARSATATATPPAGSLASPLDSGRPHGWGRLLGRVPV